jgi:hypothetical protein
VGNKVAQSKALSKKGLVIGTVIALVMGTAFTLLSSGMSLIVTFVPWVIFVWLVYVWLYVNKTELPNSSAVFPLLLSAFAVQFLHLAKEFAAVCDQISIAVQWQTLFRSPLCRFPILFVVYGAIGNATAHA